MDTINKLLKELTLDFGYIFGAINQGRVFESDTNMKDFLHKSQAFQIKLVNITKHIEQSKIQTEKEKTLERLNTLIDFIEKQVYME
ncbi:hypothetical protein ACIQ1H_13675 [Lysinibacillus sp. NPDC097279]|uniref:hypothetical protein n=1 Tax=Lysinibacillus sp. NPDC097279 TaxID=3364143 RepID=UPI0037FC440E